MEKVVIVRLRGRQVTLPKEVREFLNLHDGDWVAFKIKSDRVEVEKVRID